MGKRTCETGIRCMRSCPCKDHERTLTNLWRRIAFRLADELDRHDKAATLAIFENADVPRQGTPTDGGDR